MALLVTSCTMGKDPRQLLDKGPQYLRTKTNNKIFAHHRKSAVELLAASKPQFVKSTFDLNQKSDNFSLTKYSARSKSAYNLNQIVQDNQRFHTVDNCDGEITNSNKWPPSKPNVECCINGSQGRKINMAHREYMKTESSTTIEQLDTTNQNSCGGNGSHEKLHVTSAECHKNMSEEEKMITDSSMTLSTDMSCSQDVDMDYKSGYVQRSHSDLSCQQSRNNSAVSDTSVRFSRASADLEKFFNGMGIERNILDPMLKRQDNSAQKDADFFESISSLDSPDTRSVCSGVSKLSEKTFSSSDCLERTLQSTSVVERNARIIKWLCNIKKAKQPVSND